MMARLEDAEKEVEELARLYPDFPDVFNAIGVIRLLQNRLLEAVEHFRRVSDVLATSAIARSNLALTYYLEGDLSAAGEQAVYAANLDPGLAPAHDIAGHVAMDMNEVPEAIRHFRALVELEPANPDAHSNMGLAYYKDDRLNEAVESYKRVLIFSPKSPEGHNDLGLAYAKAKLLSEAARHLTQVIEWQPENPIVHSNLGLVYYFKGDTEDAVHQWREVTRLSPDYARSREETRFSAYDDQQMMMRAIDRRTRATHFPLKIAAFRHSFQIALDESDYRLALPWPDLAKIAGWCRRAQEPRAGSTRV
jgi:Flp pilus assembly protein TadD